MSRRASAVTSTVALLGIALFFLGAAVMTGAKGVWGHSTLCIALYLAFMVATAVSAGVAADADD